MAGLRQSKALEWTVRDFLSDCMSRQGYFWFVTVTYAYDADEVIAKKDINRLGNKFRRVGGSAVWVREYQRSGRVHFHLISTVWENSWWLSGFAFAKKIMSTDFEGLVTYCCKELIKNKQLRVQQKGFRRYGYLNFRSGKTRVRDIELEYIPCEFGIDFVSQSVVKCK